ncbi:MerR family DNA-binding transcriptional regulator [Nocardia sp. SYP-A9097]|uniref:MerR family transcriptional regulator n=1 Tax=Nocardia sp. SYP-A9097 TaxID=2663237 RepID=UPI00129A5EC2|nr:MerR family transcriptional regulator [Nocardia sp. SYP-A9097]MRH90564.1 MerR family DNA-binding transcriptional regulator [Nocardia sp. SYP-A9097]
MPDHDGLTVGAVASLVGITIRALHHWDALGLVTPSARTPGGYRVYTAADLTRIHRVLIYRELDVPLTEIAPLLDAPTAVATEALLQQRDRLRARITHLQQMTEALDRLIEARQSGILLTPEEQVAIFGNHWKPDWVTEAHSRWSGTPQWTQYAERSATRTATEWQQITDSTNALNAELAAAFQADIAPGTPEANALAERHRGSFTPYFDCTHSMQVCIARTYIDDPDFATYYNTLTPGLNTWLHQVISANARAQGINPDTATWT